MSYSGSPLYNLNKYIANNLKAYVQDENNKVKNSTTFSNYIRIVAIEDDEKMNYVNNDDQFTRKMAIPQGKFPDLVYLVFATTWCTFNSQFYQQTDGVAMGGPASSTTVEIYMQVYERTFIITALHPPKAWE